MIISPFSPRAKDSEQEYIIPTCPHCQDAGLPGFKDDETVTQPLNRAPGAVTSAGGGFGGGVTMPVDGFGGFGGGDNVPANGFDGGVIIPVNGFSGGETIPITRSYEQL